MSRSDSPRSPAVQTAAPAPSSSGTGPPVTVLDTRGVLTRNTLWNYAGFAVNLLTNLLLFPFVVARIGDAAAGVWLLLGAFTGYMGLLELGIVPSLTQTIAASHARSDGRAVSRAASTALVLLSALGTAALPLVFVVRPVVAWLQLPGALAPAAVLAAQVAVLGIALRMPLAAFQGVLLGRQRQDRCNQLWIAIAVTKLVVTVGVLSAGFGLVGLVVAEMLIHLLAGGLQIRWAYESAPGLRLSWRFVDRPEIAGLLSFGGTLMAVRLSGLLIEQTDRLVIASFLPVAMVTLYAAAWKLYMLVYTLATALVQAVSPVAADMHGRGDFAGLQRLFLRFTKYTTAVAWPLVFSLALAGGAVLRLWMGPPFIEALPVVQVLVVGFAVTAYNHAGYAVLVGMRRVGPTARWYFVPQAVLNLMLSIWLVQSLGIVGVALGTMIPALALEYFFVAFVLRELRLGWSVFLTQAVAPVLLPALVVFTPLAVAYARVGPESPILPVVAAGCSLVHAIVVWRSLDGGERRALAGLLPGAIGARMRPARLSAGGSAGD